MNPIAPIGSETIKRAAYKPWSTSTTRPTLTVATRTITKKTALKAQCTPIVRSQSGHRTSSKISFATEIESPEQFGHFLFNGCSLPSNQEDDSDQRLPVYLKMLRRLDSTLALIGKANLQGPP